MSDDNNGQNKERAMKITIWILSAVLFVILVWAAGCVEW